MFISMSRNSFLKFQTQITGLIHCIVALSVVTVSSAYSPSSRWVLWPSAVHTPPPAGERCDCQQHLLHPQQVSVVTVSSAYFTPSRWVLWPSAVPTSPPACECCDRRFFEGLLLIQDEVSRSCYIYSKIILLRFANYSVNNSIIERYNVFEMKKYDRYSRYLTNDKVHVARNNFKEVYWCLNKLPVQ